MHAKIIKFDKVDSTSLWARKNLDGLNHFDVVSAEVQPMGHGQFERKWFSSSLNGGNLYISIVLKPSNVEHLNELTRFTALIVSDVLKKYGLNPDFKFPNDILINGKKICGILAESVFVGNNCAGVVDGIGVNLNLTEEEAAQIDIPATSIFIETGKNINKEKFLEELIEHFENCYENFILNGLQNELSYVNQA